MVPEVEISPEVVRLAQYRTRAAGSVLADELARSIVEEAVYGLDPEHGLLINEDAAYSSQDTFVSALGVNDLVIGEKRFDIRRIDEEGRVSISRALVNTSYMTAGTIVVQIQGNLSGKLAGFVSAAEWAAVDKSAGDQQVLFVKPAIKAGFDVVQTLTTTVEAGGEGKPASAPEAFEVATMVANRSELSIKRQREIVEGMLTNASCAQQLAQVVATWSKSKLQRILSDGAAWSARIARIAAVAAPKFKNLSSTDIENIVAKVGETMGGQPESQAFRNLLLSTLTKEELSRSLAGATLKKASEMVEAVISGRAVNDAIKDVARNPVAVQIANQIKVQRHNLTRFAEATAQEITGAFQQLALQPAYSTHSVDPSSGVQSINEALNLLDAGELAENIKELDSAIANL